MSFQPAQLALFASWIATGLGMAMWLWTWVREKDPIKRLRFSDCGVVLIFASILTRIVVQERAMSVFDWAMVFVGPLFITAALWRLARTACPPEGRS
ncbi:hypothetical protein JIP62_04605 [Brevundimonas vitis]|uniref:Uncharacterized protein n=1 Tax=Brevundimonas vitisensis TaxID=2800818 RepID=A0ABX7BQ73_9CAUL|nr:hypothetical protein [Brevundimonas vitisensis]QQQ19386.1 hypothetical protein JIP62_04605 [Brevundimonas vitisensis]